MYRLLPNEEQEQIAESVRDFLSRELPVERFLPNRSAEVDERQCLSRMAELGWIGLGLESAQGGVGYGFPEEVILLREAGRFLVSPTLMSSMLTARLASESGNAGLADGVVRGEKRVALALQPGPPQAPFDGVMRNLYVFDWAPEDLILLVRSKPGRAGLAAMLLEPDSVIDAVDATGLDETLALKEVDVDAGTAIVRVEDPGEKWFARLLAMLAAMLVGLSEAARDLAVQYAVVREQFGRPIGSFQAVKHQCADMAVRAELSWAQTMVAGLAVQNRLPGVGLQACSAKLLAADSAQRNSDAAIQLHGGMGFQAECSAHHFVKRSLIYDAVGGSLQMLGKQIIAQRSAL